jgi:hypothetical protein
MNRTFFLHFFIFLCLILCGCITEWEAKDIDEIEGILVVEGFITDDESVITLSRSKGITYDDSDRDMTPYRVADAKVSIECDDGTQWAASGQNLGEYTIENGKLNPERQYRLKVEFEAHEYHSEFASPMVPPEIDSVFWTKKEWGQPVNIHVATHAPDGMVQYYRWAYTELWEISVEYIMKEYPSRCIKSSKSNNLLIGTTERTASGRLIEIIAEISPGSDRFSVLYRMDVTQHAISKRAYDYYTNVKKNAQQTGSLFTHIPSELRGNISCITDPDRPVIGYVDISSATRKNVYIGTNVYENPYIAIPGRCEPTYFRYTFPEGYVPIPDLPSYYINRFCVDCEFVGGKPIKDLPDDWPYQI